MQMSTSTPRNCSTCRGQANARLVFSKFTHVDYGHAACRQCGITFDSNVNDTIDVKLSAEEISGIDDEKAYRDLFIETSRIATDEGEIYSKFHWDDNDGVKAGVAAHVIGSIEKYHPNGIQRFVDVGCGDGFTSVQISRRYPESSVISIDPSPLVKRLEELPGIHPYHGILQNAGIELGSADVVAIIGNWMLHTDPKDTARAAFDALRPGGTLILDFKNVRSLTRVLAKSALRLGVDKIAMRNWLQRNFLNMRFGYNKAFVRNMLTELGFEVTEMYSKPPRLLEFKNKSEYQKGIAGMLWRSLNSVDRWRDEQAWVHVVCRKP